MSVVAVSVNGGGCGCFVSFCGCGWSVMLDMLMYTLSVGLTMEKTDIYIRIGKSWMFYVKKYFFGNFFWTVPF